jgi:hypothetical protein
MDPPGMVNGNRPGREGRRGRKKLKRFADFPVQAGVLAYLTSHAASAFA